MADRADVVSHNWRELPQIPFLSRQTFCRDKDLFDTTKYFCVATNTCLS